jgi:predicted GNAT superfamily acetyltransferase
MANIEIRECVSLDDYEQCVAVQGQVWGFSELDLVPAHVFVATRQTGGFTLGAFTPDGQQRGFVHTLFARHGQRLCYYSHMLAVLKEYQSHGLGRQLKLAQRDRALEDGVDLILWTFDPLQTLNAHFNINKLGAIVRTYEVNYYGTSGSSPLHQGLETDRLVAEWWLTSDLAQKRIAGEPASLPDVAARIAIPSNIQSVKSNDPESATAWQRRVRAEFQHHFSTGLYVGGFAPDEAKSTYEYLLFKTEP